VLPHSLAVWMYETLPEGYEAPPTTAMRRGRNFQRSTKSRGYSHGCRGKAIWKRTGFSRQM